MAKTRALKQKTADFTKMGVATQRQTILRILKFLHPKGSVFELFVKGAGNEVAAGWFSDHEKAADWAMKASKDCPKGIYVTLNPCNEEVLERANHRLKPGMKNRTSGDEIDSIENLFIDIDAVRPKGVSSTNAELRATRKLAKKIARDLRKQGFPEPFMGMSGNGYHLIYKVRFQNTLENRDLRRQFLVALAQKYDNGQAEIDQGVFNADRLVRLYGTMARKGKSTADRQHRFATILSVSDAPKPVKRRQLQAIIPEQVAKPKDDNPAPSSENGFLDVRAYLEHYGRKVVTQKSYGSATLFVLDQCIFNPKHGHKEAAIGQCENGKLFYLCFHNTCKPHTWPEARRIISGSNDLSPFFTSNPKPVPNFAEKFTIITAKDIMKTPEKEVPIINGLLSEGENLLIVGPGGIGKSLLTLNLGLNLGLPSVNKSLWGIFNIPEQFRTLYIQSENSLVRIRSRLGCMLKSNEAYRKARQSMFFPKINGDCRVSNNFADPAFQDALREMVYATGARIVVVDPLISFHHANENDNAEMRKYLDILTAISIETHASMVLIHHVGLAGHRARGATAITDWGDNVISLEQVKNETDSVLKVVHQKCRHFTPHSDFYLELTGNLDFKRWFPEGKASEVSVKEALEAIGGAAKTQELLAKQMKKMGCSSHAKAIRLIKKAVKSGLVKEIRQGTAVSYELVSNS